ncbi:PREDICTED: uncharacterized protein LOC105566797 isoform X2 [Vollenhovia emeryi]|uniref:uncharacterized protein LOC105566797 isoform X2 n=1 Tax=Vollenhovia emeryi TaxID=411798 RepID=UPI0005F4940F|nr:PREDICTED: uncharacterized protein LOC105566797 isoform X2 [Vollenhovia emeryi]
MRTFISRVCNVQNFVFHEFTWFAPAEEAFDNEDSKIRAVAPQHPATDLLVFLAICGLLFVFMILSSNSPKNGAPSYDTSNIETEDPSSFWYSRTAGLTNCYHACGDSIAPSRDVASKMPNVSRRAVSNAKMSPQSRSLNYNARSCYSKHSQKTQASRPVSQMTPREWLIRRTRSGHVYGKYPV